MTGWAAFAPWSLVCSQKCHIVEDKSYLYGQLLRKTHDRSHIDSTRNIENLKLARHFGLRLRKILYHVESWNGTPAPEQAQATIAGHDMDPYIVLYRKRDAILKSFMNQREEKELIIEFDEKWTEERDPSYFLTGESPVQI